MASKLLDPLNQLSDEAIAEMSPIDCASALEAITGGTTP